MKRVDQGITFKVLAPLVVAVLLGHLVLLQGAVSVDRLSSSQPLRAFSTRNIELPAPAVRPTPRPVAVKAPTRIPSNPAPPPVLVDSGIPATDAVHSETVEPMVPAVVEEEKANLPDPVASQEPTRNDADELALAPRSLREQFTSASHYVVPRAATLKYQVASNKFPYGLNAELGWQQDGESYDARLVFGAFGFSRVQTSRGKLTAQGLEPLRFSDKYRSEVAAHFVREKGKVTFSANTPDVPLLAGAQDRLSIVLQLAAMLAGDPDHFPPASTIALQVVGPRDADTWLFTFEEEETLTLPGGQLAARKLVRNPRQQYDQRVELWLAPALGYLPARIRITESNGDYVDQKWLASDPPV